MTRNPSRASTPASTTTAPNPTPPCASSKLPRHKSINQTTALIYPEIDLKGRFLSYDKLNDEIAGYKLSLFNPSSYIKNEFKSGYENRGVSPFSQIVSENHLIGMMKVNFLKRLESSVKSFEITMERTITRIENLEL